MGDLFGNYTEERKEEKIKTIFDVVSFIVGGGDSMKFLSAGISTEEIESIFDDSLKDISNMLFDVNANDAFKRTRSPNETTIKLIENSSARDLDKAIEVCDAIIKDNDDTFYKRIIAEDITRAITTYRKKKFKSAIVAEFKRRLGN